MIPPFATLRVSRNGAAVQTGGVTASAGDVIQLSADPSGTSGVNQYKWEIIDYPVGYALPSGWSSFTTAGGSVVYQATGAVPPTFTLGDISHWSKYKLRLTVNNGVSQNTTSVPNAQLVDEKTTLSVLSASGLRDLAVREGNEFGLDAGWAGDHKKNLRVIETFIAAGGGGGFVVDGTPAVGSVVGYSGSGTHGLWVVEGGLVISAFAATAALVETSQSVVNPAFTATENTPPTGLTLTNNANGESKSVVGTPTSFASSQTFQKTTPNLSVTFTLTGTLAGSPNAVKTCTITWGQKIFWGTSASPADTEAFVEALASSQLSTGLAKTFTVTTGSGEKMYFSWPTRLGTATFTVGGFVGGFIIRSTTISVTNAQSFTENYTLAESVGSNLGAQTVTTS